jgi:hypothetical protein
LPALFSIQANWSPSQIGVPISPQLSQSERAAAEELAQLITARDKLWLLARIKFEYAGSANQFEKALRETAAGFALIFRRISQVQERLAIDDAEAIRGALHTIVEESTKQTAKETDKFLGVISTRIEEFGSDAAVQQAMVALQKALNPQGVLAGVADALLNLCEAFKNPSASDAIEETRSALEDALAELDSTISLDEELRGLLTMALNREVDLKVQHREERLVGGPLAGGFYTVESGQSPQATELIAAAAAAQRLLTQYPEFVLLKPKIEDAAAQTATTAPPASEKEQEPPLPPEEPLVVAVKPLSTPAMTTEPTPSRTPLAPLLESSPAPEADAAPSPDVVLASELANDPSPAPAVVSEAPIIPTKLTAGPGDEVIVTHEATLFFKDEPHGTAKVGEKLIVHTHRPDVAKVFIISKDPLGKEIALTISDTAVIAAPVDVGMLLRNAVIAGEASNGALTEQLLQRAKRVAPNEPIIDQIRAAVRSLTAAESAYNKAEQTAPAARLEAARLRKNAQTIDRPNPLDSSDTSNRDRANDLREKAKQMEEEVSEKTRSFQEQIVSAKQALREIDIPTFDDLSQGDTGTNDPRNTGVSPAAPRIRGLEAY